MSAQLAISTKQRNAVQRAHNDLLTKVVDQRAKAQADHDDLIKQVVGHERQAQQLSIDHSKQVDEYKKHVEQLSVDHSKQVDDLNKYALLQEHRVAAGIVRSVYSGTGYAVQTSRCGKGLGLHTVQGRYFEVEGH